MHYNIIKTAAGARTRLRLPMVWKADAVAAEELPEAVFWVFIGGERVRVEKTPGSDDEYIFPALQAGQYAWDLVVDAQVVLHGVLKVRGSAVPPGGGEVCGTLLVDAPAMVLVLSPGPRGEVGPVGPQGLSAYEVALQHGYEGSEDEWAEELSGAQAAATAAKEQATEAGKRATAAANSAKAADSSATTASEQATAASNSAKEAAASADTAGKQATAAGNSATAAASSAGAAGEQATAADKSATAAASSADTAGKQATAASNSAKAAAASADTASEQATAAGNSASAAASSAGAACEQATAASNSAKAAAADAAAAASTLAAAAVKDGNNTFSGVNTYNAALVANDALFYAQQELGDLLSYPVAARLLDAGINPASALARTWNEWVAMNPNWESLGSLLFYAPLMQGVTLPSFTATSTPFTKCTFISPAAVNKSGCQYLLSNNITLYTLKAGSCGDVYNCYNVKKCSFYAPKVTEFDQALNATGYLNTSAALELSVYVPELYSIRDRSINTSFHRIGLLKTFSIYAPNLVSSFDFSRDTHGLGGQTCAILRALIDGIGTPGTVQTITTLTPADAENVADLQAAAAAKNWEFVFE